MAAWGSPSRRRPVRPATVSGPTGSHVPCKSPRQARAAYMPDAIRAVSRLPPDLSRGPGHAPVSTPLRFVTTRHQRFAHARLPDPHLTRSLPRLSRSAHHERYLTDAACGGLRPPPAGRPRRTYLHLLHSTASSGFYIEPSFSARGTRPAQTFLRGPPSGHALGTGRIPAGHVLADRRRSFTSRGDRRVSLTLHPVYRTGCGGDGVQRGRPRG